MRVGLVLLLAALLASPALVARAQEAESTENAPEQAPAEQAAPQEQAAEQQGSELSLPKEQAKAEEPAQVPGEGPKGSSVADPFNIGAVDAEAAPGDLPPFAQLNGAAGFVAPGLARTPETGLSLDIDARIKQTEDVVSRMVWQINRETAWANSVRDIIQNYQYKYSKVLASIKQHSSSTAKMRELLTQLKKARLHEVLESDLNKAGRELTELAASSSDTNEDDNSYAALKDRVVLMKQDLEKMSHAKVNKVLHGVQDQLKVAAEEAIPKPSSDTLKGLIDA